MSSLRLRTLLAGISLTVVAAMGTIAAPAAARGHERLPGTDNLVNDPTARGSHRTYATRTTARTFRISRSRRRRPRH